MSIVIKKTIASIILALMLLNIFGGVASTHRVYYYVWWDEEQTRLIAVYIPHCHWWEQPWCSFGL